MLEQAKWIWLPGEVGQKNVYARFRKEFDLKNPSGAVLAITASARYRLFVNGTLVGQGPPRAWPQHYSYDRYDLSPYLQAGRNCLAVLVHHFGQGNMQWIPAPPGLLAALEVESDSGMLRIGTDASWQATPDGAFEPRSPRVSIQLGYEEQFDTRRAEPRWTAPDFDASHWPQAVEIAGAANGPVQGLHARDIPFLTAHPVAPRRLLAIEAVQPVPHLWSIDCGPLFNPADSSAKFYHTEAFLFTQIHAPKAITVVFTRIHNTESQLKLNGESIPGQKDENSAYYPFFRHVLPLRRGWNTLLVDFRQVQHLARFVAILDAPVPLQMAWRGAQGGGPWALLGPFTNPKNQQTELPGFPFAVVPVTTAPEDADPGVAERLWQRGVPDEALLASKFVTEIPESLFAADDVYARAYGDRVLPGAAVAMQNPEALLAAQGTWMRIAPPGAGADVRLLLDFGREVVGPVQLEIDAPAGTVVDIVGFEHREPDGSLDWAEGANNSMRYRCCAGRQTHRGFWRLGLRYAYVILRRLTGPVRLRRIEMIENIYPQHNRGDFRCSDARLDAIWQVGRRSMACCSEDTYVDCPAYEQVHWVGDARNEALVDWVVNGDPRLWRHSLLQAAHSLERSPLVESHVPSAWPVILPAWSFLWMRSCREYFLFTGDRDGADMLWPWLLRNVAGVRRFLNADGLFEIRAWNMFDWAAMDVPAEGVVTHQNCLLVLALREAAELAGWLGKEAEATAFASLAQNLAAAINGHLYDRERQAYVDSRHADGRLSRVLSQQTQTVALVSGVAQGARARKARTDMLQPPAEYVQAGSPFFMFFLLEALMQAGDMPAVLREIRDKWGFMLDQGATTFWEMWSGEGKRRSRSHCHGWSAAPTFFLSTYVLGVQPLAPGFVRVRIEPHPGDLRWARGLVPTPHGEIAIAWETADDGVLEITAEVPEGIVVASGVEQGVRVNIVRR